MKHSIEVVIVGGVACGPKAASRLKRLRPEMQVTLLDKGKVLSYGACGLPYFVQGSFERLDALVETPVGVRRDPAFFKKVKGFEALPETEALRIDREKKTIEIVSGATGGKRSLPYDKLVLATGARPFLPPVPGADLEGIFHMHRLEDAAAVKEAAEKGKIRRAVIVGAGLIGVEMCEALTARGVQVTVVEMLPTVMGLLLDEEMGRLAMRHLVAKGADLRMGETVQAFAADGQGRLAKVKTSRGEIDADLCLVAVGVKPNSELAVKAGLAVDPKGGILINPFCQTSDADIYAGGDCVANACLHGLSGGPMFAPQGSTANKHGRVIANHIAGLCQPFAGVLGTVICRAFEITLARTGLTERQAMALGHEVETVLWTGTDLPHYFPASKPFCLKLVVNRRTRQLIGFQAVGAGDVDKRLDVAVTAMSLQASVDAMAHLDLGYAPPYAPPLDPILTAVHIAQNKIDGVTRGIPPLELRRRMEQGDADIVLLDVRTPAERQEVRLPYEERTVHIPLGALREKLGQLPRDRLIVPFCKVSLRGYEAERILSGAGFPRVAFLDGGIAGWPFELITGP
ncbi:MAG: FAD-dependent oxidoreductase [bacterium]